MQLWETVQTSFPESRGFSALDLKIFLTGSPGSGKSTVFRKIVEGLQNLGFTVGGIATPEIRSQGRRVGFLVEDIASGRKALLAGIDVSSSFRVGRYGVNLSNFESVAIPALDYAEEKCDVVVIDEIGRMELYSKRFKQRVEEMIGGRKPMISVLHRHYTKKYGGSGTIVQISTKNRGHIAQLVVSKMAESLSPALKNN